jgi:hypothetical protein
MSLLTASWLPPPFFFSWSFVGFGEVVCVFVFFCLVVWVVGLEEWSWSCSASALEFSHSPF